MIRKIWRSKRRLLVIVSILAILGIVILLTLPPAVNKRPNTLKLPPNLETLTTENIQRLESFGELYEGALLAIHPGGSLLAVAPFEAAAKIIDYLTGETVYTFTEYPRALDFSPDGDTVAFGTQTIQGHVISMWEFSTNQKLATLIGHTGLNNDVEFSADGKWLASGGFDNTVRIWDVKKKQIVAILKEQILKEQRDWISAVSFSPDNKSLASANYDGTIWIWDTSTKRTTKLTVPNAGVVDIAYNSQGNLLAAAYNDNLIRLWNPQTGENIGILRGHTRTVWRLAFAPDGQLLASTSLDNTLRLWDTTTAKPLREFTFQNILGLGGVHFSPDGRLLLLNKNLGTIEFWGVPTAN